jgi:hypothetical protein
MAKTWTALQRILPLCLLLALYWPGLTAWFFQDDFGWLNLHHDAHSAGDLGHALFAPKAHGNMRPLGENAYWLVIPRIFGPQALPLHVVTFLTQCASLLLLGAIAVRLTQSRLAAFLAQIVWMVSGGVAPAMGWSCIYNQVLSAFFFLLAFHYLVRYAETGQRTFWVAQWIAFLLGLGALESNVVYPALACVYALLFARKLVRKVLPMFAVSALAVLVHFHFAPPATSGAYAPVVDGRVPATLGLYWQWALGPMPVWLTVALSAAIVLLTVAGMRRREYVALLGLAWFAVPLLPYLPLPDHKMDYYLAVPAIGIALLAASAMRTPWRAVGAVCVIVYLGASAPKALTTTRWEHARGERMENLVLGVEEIRQEAPKRIVLLDGIDTDIFFSGVADLPFRALGIPRVYLAPAEFAEVQAPHELLSKYVLPAAVAGRVVGSGEASVYRFDGSMLHLVKRGGIPGEDEPRFVNIADDVFHEYLGEGWSAGPNGLRLMSGTSAVRIGGPKTEAERLYVGVFDTRDVGLRVTVDGVAAPVELAYRNTDLSEYRVALPAEAVGRRVLQVEFRADRLPLLFGYAEVR